MALIFFDGWDYYNDVATFSSKWKGSPIGGNPTFYSTGGRNGQGMIGWTTYGTQTPIYRWGGTPTTVYLAFAIKFITLTGSSASIATMFDSSNTVRAYLSHTNSGALTLYDGSGNLLATANVGMSAGNWYHIQWKYTPSASCASDSNIVKFNNTAVINVTSGTRTTSGTTYNAQGFSIGSISGALNSFTCYFDDLYFLDNTGSDFNDFLGDRFIGYYSVNGNGYYNQFTPVGAASNYLAAQTYNGDTSYCSSDELYRQSFTLGTFPDSIESILAIQNVAIAKKSGSGDHTIKNLLRINGTDYEGSSSLSLGTTYGQNIDLLTVNPDTGLPFTDADIQAMNTGIRVTV